jgi:hypothetical protein
MHHKIRAFSVERTAGIVVQIHSQCAGPLAGLDVEGIVADHKEFGDLHSESLGGIQHAVREGLGAERQVARHDHVETPGVDAGSFANDRSIDSWCCA